MLHVDNFVYFEDLLLTEMQTAAEGGNHLKLFGRVEVLQVGMIYTNDFLKLCAVSRCFVVDMRILNERDLLNHDLFFAHGSHQLQNLLRKITES